MWIITRYAKGKIFMYEFNTELEARESLKDIEGNKILSEVIYFNDPVLK
jgi:ArsR family metal-binding transcriptional regulator